MENYQVVACPHCGEKIVVTWGGVTVQTVEEFQHAIKKVAAEMAEG